MPLMMIGVRYAAPATGAAHDLGKPAPDPTVTANLSCTRRPDLHVQAPPIGGLSGSGLVARLRCPALLAGATLIAAALTPPSLRAQTCPEPYRVSREEIRQAMSAHGAYSLTSTTTSMRFAAEALLAIVRRRQRESPQSTQLFISQDDWFAAHQKTAGVMYSAMSAAARAGFEHHQDALVDYGPQVVERVVKGPAPLMSLDVMIFWPDSGDAPEEFSYKDTLSVPRMDMYDSRVIRFKLLEYDSMLVFDRVTGISVRPVGFLSALFTLIGKPDLKQTRIAISSDQWQVVRGQVKVFAGISKTGTATIEPGGRGHEGVPPARPDLAALAKGMKRPLELRYGEPSCQARIRMGRRGGDGAGRGPSGMGTAADLR